MISHLRRSAERGLADHGWLKSFHTFSFADYYDPRHMGFGPLRVINEDRIAPGTGFGTHGHRDMEIFSYVLEGALAHQDSMGNGSVIRPGDVQRMSAGTGVMHSEFNHQKTEETHFLQIWIEPAVRGIKPGYEERHFDETRKRGRLCCVMSPDGREGSITLNQQAVLHVGLFDGEESARFVQTAGRRCYVHLARGSLMFNGQLLSGGDAVAIESGARPQVHDIVQGKGAEVLVFDLP